MTDPCVFCNGDHNHTECPMFGKTDAYLKAYAPAPPDHTIPEEPPRSSLAPTQFEQIFGRDPNVLQDVAEDTTSYYTPEERELAWQLLLDGGFDELNAEGRTMLDGIAMRHAACGGKIPTPPVVVKAPVRTPGIHTQREMETFEEEYDPPPSQRDWPVSPDDPEGYQG